MQPPSVRKPHSKPLNQVQHVVQQCAWAQTPSHEITTPFGGSEGDGIVANWTESAFITQTNGAQTKNPGNSHQNAVSASPSLTVTERGYQCQGTMRRFCLEAR